MNTRLIRGVVRREIAHLRKASKDYRKSGKATVKWTMACTSYALYPGGCKAHPIYKTALLHLRIAKKYEAQIKALKDELAIVNAINKLPPS